MSHRVSNLLRTLFVCACGSCVFVFAAYGRALSFTSHAPALFAQEKEKDKPLQVSAEEQQAAKSIETATGAAAKLEAASAFIKKYPKSSLRPQVAHYVAEQIGNGTDPAQKITLAQNYLTVFNATGEADIINPYLLEGYIEAKRYDDAFAVPLATIEKYQDPLRMMIQLSAIGADLARQQNPKYIQQSQQLAMRAIELLEADKKPAGVTDAGWSEYKAKWLPQLYQTLAVIALISNDSAGAKTKIMKAASLNSTDPFTYIIIGSLDNDEYQKMAQQYKGMPAGAAQDEMLKKAQAQLDQVIDAYAHAVALAEADARYQKLREQLIPDLEAYYKYRHNNSTEGLQQLIDKYKKPLDIKLP